MSASAKSILGSLIGIFIFFIPITIGQQTQIPLVHLINAVHSALGAALPYLVLAILALLCLSWTLARTAKPPLLTAIHRKDGPIIGTLFFLALIFMVLLVFHLAPPWLADKNVGGLVLKFSGKVLLTVSIAGLCVLFLTEFGFLEFLGTLLEPFMRPLYRTPGVSAVDAITSFVAAPAVGIFLTDRLYRQKIYTQREAVAIMSGFSICSLGFFSILGSIGGLLDYLPHMIISAFIINFILAAIMVRIPPISRKPDLYIDGTPRQAPRKKPAGSVFSRAAAAAGARAAQASLAGWQKGAKDALIFSVKIAAYVVSIATIALLIAEHTPLFNYLGALVKPYIELMHLPDADKIAPSVLITISELALPAILIAGQHAAPAAVFFICVLSTVQIIFFTESANAMLESEVPISVLDLILIFLLRTVFAIPLTAAAAHLIF